MRMTSSSRNWGLAGWGLVGWGGLAEWMPALVREKFREGWDRASVRGEAEAAPVRARARTASSPAHLPTLRRRIGIHPGFGAALREARERRGIVRREIATFLGVSYETVKMWEKDAATPSEGSLTHLVTFFPALVPWVRNLPKAGTEKP